MAAHRREFRLTTMCRVLRMHRSGFYAWMKTPQSRRAKEDERIRKKIRAFYQAADVFDYIEVFYNRIRRHSHLGQMSPHDFEQAALNQA